MVVGKEDVWMTKLAIALWVSILTILAFSTVGFAQTDGPDSISDDQVNAVAKQLYCPVCENIPLDVCPTQACSEWREMIREKLAEGWNETQVKNYFVEQYGDRVVGAPPARGLNWLMYVIPPLAIVLGAIFLFGSMVLWQKRSKQTIKVTVIMKQPDNQVAETLKASPSQDDEYIRKFEEELKKI
jgi:cytochrome c-type biogenesis protein CcmH